MGASSEIEMGIATSSLVLKSLSFSADELQGEGEPLGFMTETVMPRLRQSLVGRLQDEVDLRDYNADSFPH